MLHLILYLVIAIVAVFAAITIAGLALPRDHQAARAARIARPAAEVWRAVRDLESGPRWRSGLTRVELLDADPPRWREHARHGRITFVLDESAPPDGARAGRMVSRIADDNLPFGGRWIFAVAPDGDATRVTITEDGFVANPLFRFLSRFVFGHGATLEQYLRDLARHLGTTASPEVAPPSM
jgi:Polyketide cyclase / dehydrase and lipid transport